MAIVAGIDIGGTNIEGAIVDDDHSVRDSVKVPTPTEGPEAVVEAVEGLLEELGAEVDGIGVGIPGPVNAGVVTTPPNLEGWDEPVNLKALLATALEIPVEVGNDVNVAVLGEWSAGAGKGSQNLLGVWMGTGIGGGLILGGRPYNGTTGHAGEFGHMIVRPGGAQCSCGHRGCIEAYAGRNSMEDTARRAVDGGAASTTLFSIMEDKGKDRATSSVWVKALDNEDALAVRLFGEAVEAVAVGIASVLSLLDLDRVIIGGGLAEKMGEELVERLWAAVEPHCFVPMDSVEFVVAELEDYSGIVGAAALGRAGLLLGG